MPTHTLILGGAKSGKTRLALRLAEAWAASPVYLATATAGDAEMTQRIARHQTERGPRWRTVEEPLALAEALAGAARPDGVVLVDCLTLWLGNLLTMAELGDDAIEARLAGLAEVLPGLAGPAVLVINEVGLGIVPDNALSRRFRDLTGGLSQRLAAVCDHVVFVAAGLPLMLKGGPLPL